MASQEFCECGKPIETMAFKGSGVCGENCRKVRDKEHPEVRSQTDAGLTNLLMPQQGVNLNGIR